MWIFSIVKIINLFFIPKSSGEIAEFCPVLVLSSLNPVKEWFGNTESHMKSHSNDLGNWNQVLLRTLLGSYQGTTRQWSVILEIKMQRTSILADKALQEGELMVLKARLLFSVRWKLFSAIRNTIMALCRRMLHLSCWIG